MMNLTRKARQTLILLVLLAAMASPAAAADTSEEEATSVSFWEDIKSFGSGLYQGAKENAPAWWQTAKDAASDVSSTVKEHGPEWAETAKDGAEKFLDTAKDVSDDAQHKFFEWNGAQPGIFWDWFGEHVGTGSQASSNGQTNDSQANDAQSNVSQANETTGNSVDNAIGATTPATSDEPIVAAATTNANAGTGQNTPGYTMSNDGKTVVIDGETYYKLNEWDKMALKNGRARLVAFFCVGLPLLIITGAGLSVFIILDRRKQPKKRRRKER